MALKREIEAAMVAYIDKKLKTNGMAQELFAKPKRDAADARKIFLLALESCVGIREVGGNNRGPLVKLIQETIGGANNEAWCMSLVQTCIAYAEAKTGVKSPLLATELCSAAWDASTKKQRVQTFPLPGAIAIWTDYDTKAKKFKLSGHTEVVTWADPKISTWKGIGGNTTAGVNDMGQVVSDGGGVYLTKRNFTGTSTRKLRGFIKPF